MTVYQRILVLTDFFMAHTCCTTMPYQQIVWNHI